MRDMLIIKDGAGKVLCYCRTHEQIVRVWDAIPSIPLAVRRTWTVEALYGWGDQSR